MLGIEVSMSTDEINKLQYGDVLVFWQEFKADIHYQVFAVEKNIVYCNNLTNGGLAILSKIRLEENDFSLLK
jgi:hypothetical protein